MKRGAWFDAVRVCCLVAMAISALMLVDYTAPAPTFCTDASGCGAIRDAHGEWFGFLPVPLVGLVAYACVLALSLVSRLERVALYGVSLGAAGGAVFIAMQLFWIRHTCVYCMVVDITAIVALIFALLHLRAARNDAQLSGESRLRDGAWGVLALIVGFAPPVWAKVGQAEPAAQGMAEYEESGKINVFEFADFECPHCRKIHPIISKLLVEYGKDVHFRRFMVPMKSHRYAQPAALAYICATDEGLGEPLADKMFATRNLDDASITKMASEVGVDAEAFSNCLRSPVTAATLEQHVALFKRLQLRGIPVTLVDDQQIVGSQPESVFRDAFERALQGSGGAGIPGLWYTVIVVVLMLVVVGLGRARDPE